MKKALKIIGETNLFYSTVDALVPGQCSGSFGTLVFWGRVDICAGV